ncbi:hypothetical protein, partial [Streptomyces sp. P17]|uniref:hypothetical protein n=1 Tax=Streptomyces sp. P17 TaxID=3074716 RepID=UPI0028F40636
MSETLFPIDLAEDFIRMFGQSLERNDLSLRWLSYGGTSELSVTPIHQQTSDELAVQEVVKLTHTFPA